MSEHEITVHDPSGDDTIDETGGADATVPNEPTVLDLSGAPSAPDDAASDAVPAPSDPSGELGDTPAPDPKSLEGLDIRVTALEARVPPAEG